MSVLLQVNTLFHDGTVGKDAAAGVADGVTIQRRRTAIRA